jgi:phosphate-selective porin OprO/OprP
MCSRIAVAAIVVVFAAAGTANAQKKKDKRGLVWDNRPSIVFGKDIHLDIRMKLQTDWRTFDPDVDEKLYDFHSLRFGLKGEVTKHFSYEFERELSSSLELGDWKDVYVDWHTYDAISIQGGRFKVPFSAEQLTGPTDTDFAYRSLAATIIAPARDKGGMVYGRFFGRGLTYQAGVFKGDGDGGQIKEEQFVEPGGTAESIGPSFAGRVTAAVLRPLPVPQRLRSLRLGAAYTNAQLPEGLNSLRGKSVFGTATFFERVYVKGRRQRIGTELEWTPGPFGLKAEWMQAREDRLQQSNRNADLSDFVSTGWYVGGTWVVTGESKGDSITPKKPLFKGGIGAIEIGARYDQLGFASASTEGPAFTNPRAEHLVPNTDQVWTIGANYFPNRWVRLVGNAIHENFADTNRSIVKGTAGFWAILFRFQLVF